MLNPFEKDPRKMKVDFQVWRYFTAMFFHLSFSHIIMNLVSQLIYGLMLESMIGFNQMAALYIFSG